MLGMYLHSEIVLQFVTGQEKKFDQSNLVSEVFIRLTFVAKSNSQIQETLLRRVMKTIIVDGSFDTSVYDFPDLGVLRILFHKCHNYVSKIL